MGLSVSLPDSLFECSSQKIWCCWDNNLSELTDALKERVTDYLHKYQRETDCGHYEADISLALWLLDRLLPLNEKDIFVPFLGEMSLRSLGGISEGSRISARPWKRAILAWGRRLSGDHRSQLLLIPFNQPRSEKGKSRRRLCYPVGQEVLAAWCETCPAGQEDTLFTWPDLSDMCQTVCAPEDISILVEEYVRRSPDRTARLSVLVDNAAKLTDFKKKYGKQKWGSVRFHLLRHILRQIIKDIAPEFTLNDYLPGGWRNSSEDWHDWLKTVLAKAGYDTVAKLCHQLNPYREGHLLAVLFRIETMSWQQLERHILRLENLPHHGFADRLADVVPSGRLDVWEMILKSEKTHYSFAAFCRWLQPEYRDVLLKYCNFCEADCRKALCAFYSYLSKTPHTVLEAMWQSAELLPAWQSQELDRCLFAPEPIKPPQLLPDIQNIEADLRLEDILSQQIIDIIGNKQMPDR